MSRPYHSRGPRFEGFCPVVAGGHAGIGGGGGILKGTPRYILLSLPLGE